MNIRKLTKEEFTRAIENGLGSAFLHVKEYGDSEVQDELLKACVENLVFDTQINSRRGRWLVEMLQHTEQIQNYASEIRQKLLDKPEDETTYQQLIDIAAVLFEIGFGEFKEILLNLSVSNQSDETVLSLAQALVDVASYSGLVAGIQRIQRLPNESWIKKPLYEYACEELGGTEEVNSFLENKSKLDEDLNNYWKAIQIEDDCSYVRQPPLTLKQVIDSIETDTSSVSKYRYKEFGKTATSKELQTIMSKIENERDPKRLSSYLEVFGLREIPLITSNAREMLFSEDLNLLRCARNALSKTKSLILRDIAIELLKTETDRNIVCGLKLLELNYISNDIELIRVSLRKIKDLDWIHWGAMSVTTIAEKENMTEELIWICEFNPCGFCRKYALNQLVKTDKAPAQLIYEAQWDAEREIRHLARAHILE